MPLSVGDKLGHYEVISLLGNGGMGEVYRARDTTLKRDVALKVLPATFLADPDRMARFQREAQVLASLDHPNIGPIYGIADSADSRGLVLALIEGPTLADRIAAGALPPEEAFHVAKQIIEALEYAHDRGVIHRDLKPANVKITPEGVVKVLDFGLAKVLEDEPPASSLTKSPTLTVGHTRAGVILGTAAYMSPEQAVGRPVDRRSDIFSFGAVLYEMLTGQRAFAGATTPDVLEAVVKNDPDWSKLPAGVSGTVRQLLRRCLVKDRKQRLQAIGEARIMLDNPGSEAEASRGLKPALPWSWIAVTALATGVALWGWLKPTTPEPRQVTHFITSTPKGPGSGYAVSRDGSRIAFGTAGGSIYLRAMDDPVAKPIPGTEGGTFPTFSPDGQWLAFFFGKAPPFQVKKVPITGGAALTLATGLGTSSPMGWGDDGSILLGGGPILRISDAGGEPVAIAKPEAAKGELAFLQPHYLPGGKYVLASVITSKGLADFTLAAINVQTGERKALLEGVGTGYYAATGTQPGVGHLVYGRNGSIFAATFNVNTLQVGSPAPVLEGVLGVSGFTAYSFSQSGTLAYVAGGLLALIPESTLIWVDRQGVAQPLAVPSRSYSFPRISPDGGRIAFQVFDLAFSPDIQVWVHDVARRTTRKITFDQTSGAAVWTPDGKRLIYVSSNLGQSNGIVASVAADGSGPPVTLMGEGLSPSPTSVSADGKLVIGVRADSAPGAPGDKDGKEAWVLPLDRANKEAKPQPFLDTRFTRGYFQFSPDGKWVAYESNETGRNEIYVVPYPGPGGKSQVSIEGGTQPRWNRNGREMFFRSGDKMMAVDVETGAAFRAGSPKILFMKASPDYDVAPDGKRFIMLKPVAAPEGAPSELHVILNWFDELRRRVPGGK